MSHLKCFHTNEQSHTLFCYSVLFVFQQRLLPWRQSRSELTNDHEELLLLLDDVDLEHGAQAWDVGQGVLDDVQGVEPLLRAHQHDLQQGQRVLTWRGHGARLHLSIDSLLKDGRKKQVGSERMLDRTAVCCRASLRAWSAHQWVGPTEMIIFTYIEISI